MSPKLHLTLSTIRLVGSVCVLITALHNAHQVWKNTTPLVDRIEGESK